MEPQFEQLLQELKNHSTDVKEEIKILVSLKLENFRKDILELIDKKLNLVSKEIELTNRELSLLNTQVEQHEVKITQHDGDIKSLKEDSTRSIEKPLKTLFWKLVILGSIVVISNIVILGFLINVITKR